MINGFRRTPGVVAALLLVSFAAAGLAGCTTTQTPGEQVSDSAIATDVKARLTADRFSNIVNVEVNVTNGIVTLAGEVPNEQVRADAEAEVRKVSGVKGVNNNLQVSSPPRP